uniref:Uncharacterized protein n=1 Tax=Heterosigma akashiwo TaxID=2829 RepID=A0A7S4DCV7_HETAK
MGDINDDFSVDKSLAENAVASAHFVYSITAKMKNIYGKDDIKINTLIREVVSSVQRLSDFAIADMNKSSVGDPPPRANDFLQRIEVVDIQSSLNTVQEGLAEVKALLSKDRGPNLPKGQHLPPHRSEASPVWGNNIIRLASASPITSTPMQTKGITALHRSSPLLPFGEIIYNNALMMHNVKVAKDVNRKEFFAALINRRLNGRIVPISVEDIDEVTRNDDLTTTNDDDPSTFTIFFNADFKSTKLIFENSFCFSNHQIEEKVWLSPLLSPWEVKLRANARRLAYQICKDVHKDKEWWNSIKVYESGYSLKLKIFPVGSGAKPPRIVRFSLVGLTSAKDPGLKSGLSLLLSKVKFGSVALNDEEDKSNDDSV